MRNTEPNGTARLDRSQRQMEVRGSQNPAACKPGVPRLSKDATRQQEQAKAEAEEAARILRLSESPFPLLELPPSIQACVFEAIAPTDSWLRTIASKTNRSVRELIHSETVLAVECDKAAVGHEPR